MLITNVSRGDLIEALNRTNQIFEGNILFWKRQSLNRLDTQWRVRLSIMDTAGKGVKRVAPYRMSNNNFKQFKVPWACFHVHGEFFNSLFMVNPKARVHTFMFQPSIVKAQWKEKGWKTMKFDEKGKGKGGMSYPLKNYGIYLGWGNSLKGNWNTDFCDCLGDPKFALRMLDPNQRMAKNS